jgi:hypothetical protein
MERPSTLIRAGRDRRPSARNSPTDGRCREYEHGVGTIKGSDAEVQGASANGSGSDSERCSAAAEGDAAGEAETGSSGRVHWGDASKHRYRWLARKFQSTRPRGARPAPPAHRQRFAVVSIHAPTRGATILAVGNASADLGRGGISRKVNPRDRGSVYCVQMRWAWQQHSMKTVLYAGISRNKRVFGDLGAVSYRKTAKNAVLRVNFCRDAAGSPITEPILFRLENSMPDGCLLEAASRGGNAGLSGVVSVRG